MLCRTGTALAPRTRQSGPQLRVGCSGERRPNILLVMTDQLRYPPPYESDELREFRREKLTAEERLRDTGVSFQRHYTMAAACAPSRASLLTGHYPSLHGVTQTDGLAKNAESDDMFWLAPDTVPTVGDWFRACGYRTFYKGKWHVSHTHLDDPEGDGPRSSRSRTTGRRSRRTSPRTCRRTCSTSGGSRSGRGPSCTGWKAQYGDGGGRLHGRRDGRVALTARRGGERRAVAHRLLVPEPARHRHVRGDRARPGAAI